MDVPISASVSGLGHEGPEFRGSNLDGGSKHDGRWRQVSREYHENLKITEEKTMGKSEGLNNPQVVNTLSLSIDRRI